MFYKPSFLSSAALALGLMCLAPSAQALCAAQPEHGNWRNVDADTRSITRATLTFTCKDQVRNGVPWPPGPTWRIKLWGSCSPSDCEWDEVAAERRDDGWIFGRIDQGFAKREVWAKPYGSQLRIYIRTDFVDPNRSDYNSDDYFVN